MRAPYTQLFVHLVWSTYERAPVLKDGIEKRIYDSICRRCIDLKCRPVAIGGIEDHLHLLVQLHPAVAVADLVKDIKGASSHLINHEISPGINFRWQGAYGAFSIRASEVNKVKAYIANQPQHHAEQTLVPELEIVETQA